MDPPSAKRYKPEPISSLGATRVVTENDVTIHLEHVGGDTDEGECGALTAIYVVILLGGKAIGKISGTIIDREAIPEYGFYDVMDYSSELDYVGASLFERRLGRTKLQSLREQGDDSEFDILYIDSIAINQEYTAKGSSDVGSYALRKLLYHPYIRGGHYLAWKCSCCIYLLQNTTPASRNHAIQFLRNGFYQDKAVVNKGDDRFLVAAYGHWMEPLKSHAEAAAIQFLVAPPNLSPPIGKDIEILGIIERTCQAARNGTKVSSSYQSEVNRLISQGGSLARTSALHVACANQNKGIVEYILRKDPSTVERRDETSSTPLVVAAASAAALGNVMGLSRDQPIIDLLLAAGARKDAVNSKGMTAYGTFVQVQKRMNDMLQTVVGRPGLGLARSTLVLSELKSKLMPPGGPGVADIPGGHGADKGFVDYSQEDAEMDQQFGRYDVY